MTEFNSLEEIKQFIKSGRIRLIYLSRPACGVCTAIKPKVEEILSTYNQMEGCYVNMDSIPESAGEFSIFTIPGILIYIDGRETIREARYISIEELRPQIDRFYNMIYN